MINKFLNRPVLVLGVIALLILGSIPFQKKIDAKRNKFRAIENTIYLNSSTLKKASLGFDEIVADIYWFRVLQYFGDSEGNISDKDPDLVYKYFDIITDLDPHFINAYRFGGSFLAEPVPIGVGDIDKGTKLLDKGRKNNPDNFRLPFEEAFLYYLYTDNYERAAELFQEASESPGLSDFRSASIRGMAASARAKSGDRELSKQIWEYIYENTSNEGRKEHALRKLKELNTKDFEDRLTELVRKFYADYGSLPNSLEEMVTYGYLKKVPKDHEGEKFIIAPEIKAVKSMALLKKYFRESIGFLNSRAARFKKQYERYPENVNELRLYINQTATLRKFPEHPLGEPYIYNSETGEVDYDKSFLN